MKAADIYNKLIETNIINSCGHVNFELNKIQTHIKDNSVVGNLIGEWLKAFMQHHNIDYDLPSNTQQFPDFLLNPLNHCVDLIEVKCFTKSPNFDVANFSAYCRSLVDAPYRLDADYLIFEYQPTDAGICIKNLWLKKVWEVTGPSERAALKIQWKQNIPYNIRPAVWYSTRQTYKPFETRYDFVTALKKILDTSPLGGDWRKNWFKNVSELYKKQTGNDL